MTKLSHQNVYLKNKTLEKDLQKLQDHKHCTSESSIGSDWPLLTNNEWNKITESLKELCLEGLHFSFGLGIWAQMDFKWTANVRISARRYSYLKVQAFRWDQTELLESEILTKQLGKLFKKFLISMTWSSWGQRYFSIEKKDFFKIISLTKSLASIESSTVSPES